MPRRRELQPLLTFDAPRFSTDSRLASALTIWDLRRLARRRTLKAAFDYVDGAAESEIGLRRARQAFEDLEFHPQVLKDVTTVDLTSNVLGGSSSLPFGIAPTGFTRLMRTEGERAGAGAAGAAGIPFSLSTLGTTSIEDVTATNPNGRNWFQLYMWRDRALIPDAPRGPDTADARLAPQTVSSQRTVRAASQPCATSFA